MQTYLISDDDWARLDMVHTGSNMQMDTLLQSEITGTLPATESGNQSSRLNAGDAMKVFHQEVNRWQIIGILSSQDRHASRPNCNHIRQTNRT